MRRLLSPNEAKFWLLDLVAPMNTVVVVQREPHQRVEAPSSFAIPVATRDAQGRPRWSEAARAGVFAVEHVTDDTAWLPRTERLLDVRVGSDDHPPWHAVCQHRPGCTTLLLAINHAVADWRTGLLIAGAFLADAHPGPLAPPCEEMLPASSFGAPDAEEVRDAWWSGRAGARWAALGLDRLTAHLPPAAPTRFAMHRYSPADTGHLQARCEAEGVSLNSALAIAIRDTMAVAAVAHAVGMARFIRPAPPPGPGLAVAHVFTRLTAGPFWDAARDNRAELFIQVREGVAGDMLLALPRSLFAGAARYDPDPMTITGAPTIGARMPGDPSTVMQLVLSSARGGGGILVLSYHRDCLQLIAGTPDTMPPVPLAAIVACLHAACA